MLSLSLPMPVTVLDPDIVVEDVLDLDAFNRAWHGAAGGVRPAPTAVRGAQLTVTRNGANDFQDRQVYLWLDDEPLGKIRFGRPLTISITAGPHRVRAFNTLVSDTVQFTATPGEHVRLRCTNGMPTVGYLMMIILHVTALSVRLEREA